MKLLLITDTDNFEQQFWLRDGIKRVGLESIILPKILTLRNPELLNRTPRSLHEMNLLYDEQKLDFNGVLFIPSDTDFTKFEGYNAWIREQIEIQWRDDRWSTLKLNGDYGWLWRKTGDGLHDDSVWIYPKQTGHYDMLYPGTSFTTAPNNHSIDLLPIQPSCEPRGMLWLVGFPSTGTSFLAGYLIEMGWHTGKVQQLFNEGTEWNKHRTHYNDLYTMECMSAMCAHRNDEQFEMIKHKYNQYIQHMRQRIPPNFFIKATDMASQLFRRMKFQPTKDDKVIVLERPNEDVIKRIFTKTVITDERLLHEFRFNYCEKFAQQHNWLDYHVKNELRITLHDILFCPVDVIRRINEYLGTEFDEQSFIKYAFSRAEVSYSSE
jgi:hypothetical protein